MTLGKPLFDDPAKADLRITPDLFNIAFKTAGTFVANGASAVTVANSHLSANSVVLIGLKTVGGTVGALPKVATRTPGTGFTVTATALDTSTYWYIIVDIGQGV